MEQKPSIGRIVLFRAEPSNGTVEHPAIINRVWTDTYVNLLVFPDCGQPVVKTSVLFDDDADLSKNACAWRWPPRV